MVGLVMHFDFSFFSRKYGAARPLGRGTSAGRRDVFHKQRGSSGVFKPEHIFAGTAVPDIQSCRIKFYPGIILQSAGGGSPAFQLTDQIPVNNGLETVWTNVQSLLGITAGSQAIVQLPVDTGGKIKVIEIGFKGNRFFHIGQ